MVEIIAEVATNHGGSLGRAIQFVDAFAKAGADTIKFQYTRYKRLARTDPQYDWFAKAEFSDRDFHDLSEYVYTLGKNFLLTVYHPDDVLAVRGLTNQVKVGSGEAHSTKLADQIKSADFSRVLVSNGVLPPSGVYRSMDAKLLACISRYPHPANLVASKLLEYFADGWSDHCVGLDGCMTAITLGAQIVEKHVQLKTQARTPSPWEATVEEIQALRQWADQDPKRFVGRWDHAK
jgi:sialic acid synthase SpsE